MKRHVLFTNVSIDPEIQRMRDIPANGGYVGDDGSIYNDREAAAMNQNSGVKAKAIPKTVVSIDEGIQRIFQSMKMDLLFPVRQFPSVV